MFKYLLGYLKDNFLSYLNLRKHFQLPVLIHGFSWRILSISVFFWPKPSPTFT